MIKTDSIYLASHKSAHPCQDYAKHTDKSVVLSDGCSSCKDTDIGARLLVTATLNWDGMNFPYDDIIHTAKGYSGKMNYSDLILSGTLLYGEYYQPSNLFSCKLFGDGVLIARYRDTKKLIIKEIEFPSGAPFYPLYKYNSKYYDDYIKKYGPEYKIKEYHMNFNAMSEISLNVREHMPYEAIFDVEEFDMIVLMSDGIKSFKKNINTETSKTTKDVSILDIIPEFINFKNTGKDFLKRRVNSAMKKFNQEGVYNYDDLSIAVMLDVLT